MKTADLVADDLYRFTGKRETAALRKYLKYNLGFRYVFYLRKAQASSGLARKIFHRLLWKLECRTGIEIPLSAEIGPGLQLIHPYNITINSGARIGKNCVILKGATVGNTKSGKNPGAPVLGDNVYLGVNSTVVGGVHIGSDVLIAANTFVNFDVPDHSVVIGNPGVIHRKADATKEYIQNQV